MVLISIETVQLGFNRCGLPGILAVHLRPRRIGPVLPRIHFSTFSQVLKQSINRLRDAIRP